MPNTFFTSDSHFGHASILKPTMDRPRPFATIEEHDARDQIGRLG